VTVVELECTIRNELGLHLRAAAAFVKLAECFQSDITLQRDGNEVNGKSIIALVTLAAPKGTPVRIRAKGPDAESAVGALSGLINEGFGEVS
jgi:phosphocarrier protein